jgi:hypothetical protein
MISVETDLAVSFSVFPFYPNTAVFSEAFEDFGYSYFELECESLGE